MRVRAIQMNAGADKADNIAQARRLIDGAVAADRPDIISLPEVWSCMGGDRDGKFRQAEELPPPGSNIPGGEAYEFLRATAREKQRPRLGKGVVHQGAGLPGRRMASCPSPT